jgi:hypothetical protein
VQILSVQAYLTAGHAIALVRHVVHADYAVLGREVASVGAISGRVRSGLLLLVLIETSGGRLALRCLVAVVGPRDEYKVRVAVELEYALILNTETIRLIVRRLRGHVVGRARVP